MMCVVTVTTIELDTRSVWVYLFPVSGIGPYSYGVNVDSSSLAELVLVDALYVDNSGELIVYT